jgi:hypothetical protein
MVAAPSTLFTNANLYFALIAITLLIHTYDLLSVKQAVREAVEVMESLVANEAALQATIRIEARRKVRQQQLC